MSQAGGGLLRIDGNARSPPFPALYNAYNTGSCSRLHLRHVFILFSHCSDVDLQLRPGQRCGLVGANGCGKSTLLKCLTGHRLPDSGRVMLAHGMEVGYLEQTSVSGSDKTVIDEARSRMTALIAAEKALEVAAQAAADEHPKGLQMMEKAQEAFEAAGGYDADKRIANVLSGLGFK